MHPTFPEPLDGASLLLAFHARPQTAVLILGGDQLAATRAFSALEANYEVIIMTPGGRASVCEELAWRADRAQLTIVDSEPDNLRQGGPTSEEYDANALGSYLDAQLSVRLVFVTDTILGGPSTPCRSRASRAEWR